MWFPRRMQQISWTAKTVFREADSRSLISRISKRQATFFGRLMRSENRDLLETTGMIEGKQREKKCCLTNEVADCTSDTH